MSSIYPKNVSGIWLCPKVTLNASQIMSLGLNSVLASVSPRLRSKALTMASRVLWAGLLLRLSFLPFFPCPCSLLATLTSLLSPPSPLLPQGLCVGFLLCMDVLYPNIQQANAFSSFRPLLKCYLIRQVFPEHYTAHLCIVDKTVPSSTPYPLTFSSFAIATIWHVLYLSVFIILPLIKIEALWGQRLCLFTHDCVPSA